MRHRAVPNCDYSCLQTCPWSTLTSHYLRCSLPRGLFSSCFPAKTCMPQLLSSFHLSPPQTPSVPRTALGGRVTEQIMKLHCIIVSTARLLLACIQIFHLPLSSETPSSHIYCIGERCQVSRPNKTTERPRTVVLGIQIFSDAHSLKARNERLMRI